MTAAEIEARLARARAAIGAAGIDAILLTAPADILWATGFLTRFWESPTRPWFVVLPASGPTVAVVPEIGAPPMRRAHAGEVRCWDSPGADGLPLLADALAEAGRRIGLPDGPETHARMPLADLDRLRADRRLDLVSDDGVMRALRMHKSPADVAGIERACDVGARAFARMEEAARPGAGLDACFRRFQSIALEEGADWVAYLAGGAGPLGYADVISPAGPEPLAPGDLVMLDTGIVLEGWFCDFDRNLSLGPPSQAVGRAGGLLEEGARAGFEAARPGALARDVRAAMNAVLGGPRAGRLGHGLGLSLTEPPSLAPWDDTPLAAGMVLTLEPWVATGPGSMIVHEEVIEVTPQGARWMTGPDPAVQVAA